MRSILVQTLVLVALAACSNNPSRAPSATREIQIQLDHEPISLDPSLAEDGVAIQVLNETQHGLMGYDSDGKLEQRLAESYTISKDAKKYEFTLRPGLKWSDGKPLSACDFEKAIYRTLSPTTTAKLAPLFFAIVGARAYHSGTAKGGLGVHCSDLKLTIELESPIPYFLHTLTLTAALPQRSDILESNHGLWPETAPGTGPYRLVRHRPDQEYLMEANPYFWGTPPRLNRFTFKVVSDESTAIHLFENGQLDIITRVSSLDLSRLKNQGLLRTEPFVATYYLSFNCRKAPSDNLAWRRNLAHAIRKADIAKVLGGGERPASSWIPFGLEGFFSFRESPSQAPEKSAKSNKAVAGFDHSTRNARIFEIVQQNLKNELGLELSLEQTDWKSYLGRLQSDPPSVFRMGWMAPISDPITHLQIFTTGNPNNYSKCSSPKYDQLVKEIESLPPGPKRLEKITLAQEILLEEIVAVVPIYHYVLNSAVAPRVKGFKTNPFGVIAVDTLSLK